MRLTKKFNKYGRKYCFNCKENISFSNGGDNIVYKSLYKLGQYEDNEEKIGIDLNIIVNLDTFYSKGDDGKIYEVHMGKTKYDNGETVEKYIDFKNLCIHVAYFWGGTYMADKNLYFKDYGKTWALTKEELI